jgi:hypothetical protein
MELMQKIMLAIEEMDESSSEDELETKYAEFDMPETPPE